MDNSGKPALIIGLITLVFTVGIISLVSTALYVKKTPKFAKKNNIFSDKSKLGNVQNIIMKIRKEGIKGN